MIQTDEVRKVCVNLPEDMAKESSWKLLKQGYTVRLRPATRNNDVNLLAWKKGD